MGSSQSSLQAPEEPTALNLEESLETHEVLKHYRIEAGLVPGSGRMMRTYRLRHRQAESTAVMKAMWVNDNDKDDLEAQRQELVRIQQALAQGQAATHVACFSAWFQGDARHMRVATTQKTLRPVYLLRPHVYTTLGDRLASRPWLHQVDKLFITSQVLQALDHIHKAGVVHGFLTTENIGLTATGWVVLLDFASYKAQTALPDDDPSDYLYYFQPQNQHADAAKRSEKRCYLAPERFYTPSKQDAPESKLTPAMDLFSTGCVLTELFLNGERCLDLGDLMDYRRAGRVTANLQQKLNKIESSALRAACRHMLHLDPAERLSAHEYWQRLHASGQIPDSFELVTNLVERVTTQVIAPDARLAIAVSQYSQVLWETVGKKDRQAEMSIKKVLGRAALEKEEVHSSEKVDPDESPSSTVLTGNALLGTQSGPNTMDDLFAETEALLRQLESLDFDGDDSSASKEQPQVTVIDSKLAEPESVDRSPMCRSSLLIYLQVVLSTVRHLQRPASKLVALKLIERLARHSSDEARLQRIVPVTVSLLHDQDSLVRALALQVMTSTLSIVESFPPSDSKVFPQYIFKRIAHMISDPSLIVRLAFARCISTLAETAHRFLDISHAVRLYEAVGSGTGASTSDESGANNVFGDDVTKLLDTDSKSNLAEPADALSVESERSDSALVAAGKTLISSTYNAELTALQENVTRWVVHITTDQAEYAALPKRALLSDLGRLCSFFGMDGVMSFILPQVLAFLNDRKDWELRAALFGALPSVCHIIGRCATETYVLPCVEIGLVDVEEGVISSAMSCLARLIEMSLLSRSVLIGGIGSNVSKPGDSSLLQKYVALLIHPSDNVRHEAHKTFSTACCVMGSPDCGVYLVPILRPFLRFEPSLSTLCTLDGMETCIQPPWTRERFSEEMKRCAGSSLAGSSGAWTSIGIQLREDTDAIETQRSSVEMDSEPQEKSDVLRQDPHLEHVRSYLRMLARHTVQSPAQERPSLGASNRVLASGIEGSVKLAQSIMFPRQDGQTKKDTIPGWYSALRDAAELQNSNVSEATAIRSVSTLGHVYGLSIMGPVKGSTENIVGAADDAQGSDGEAEGVLRSPDSKILEGAFSGEWGSEALVEPDIVDTSLLVTKLKSLDVPPLPPQFGEQSPAGFHAAQLRGSAKEVVANDWKPRINALVASSTPTTGHTAPVVRLATALDNSFFVSGSHDGTCRVWETPLVEESVGVLESSLIYTGHTEQRPARVNDVAMVEGSHSVVSGDSAGMVHVWRVDMISASKTLSSHNDPGRKHDSYKAVGTTNVRTVNPEEGEILAVSHFNTSSASIITFGTQKGSVHSWDLRSAKEPFTLHHGPELGYLTSVVLGSDRNWIVAGTNRGFMALWDLRFQQPVKLWRHSRAAPISRLATSVVAPPHTWGSRMSASGARPFIFAACGANECAMFDALSGSCFECFRAVVGDSRELNAHVEEPPSLVDVPMSGKRRSNVASSRLQQPVRDHVQPISTINCMAGSLGSHYQSFLLTGGSDGKIRFWDFLIPSKCYVVSGLSQTQPRPSFERIDFDVNRRLMLCRHPLSPGLKESNKLFHGLQKPEYYHSDSIQDLKMIENNFGAHNQSFLLSCSRDCTVKVWR